MKNEMLIKKYADMKKEYLLPEVMQGEGEIYDSETGHAIAVGFVTKREVIYKIGYCCDKGAPELLHACACALLSQVNEMEVMKINLLDPSIVWKTLGADSEVDGMLKRFSAMVFCALQKAFECYVEYRTCVVS